LLDFEPFPVPGQQLGDAPAHRGPRGFSVSGIAGVDLALWDLLGRSLGANPLLHELVHEPFEVVDGQLEIPDRPGLGITVNEEFVRRYARA
jgi:L-alanine-DL-glutamate epimerase-like enolase superfamily enzyme